jgi:hypothetical protein
VVDEDKEEEEEEGPWGPAAIQSRCGEVSL